LRSKTWSRPTHGSLSAGNRGDPLADDAVSAAAPIAGLSDRARRRLFERLMRLGALRELSGRATFRLYGL